MEKMFTREQMVDKGGKYLTISLFLETYYETGPAIFTLKEYDHTYEGKVYYSLKKLYLEMEDPTEYEFATTYLCGWQHWQRMCENKRLKPHILEWREELEHRLRAKAVKHMIRNAEGGSAISAKWLADRGWINRAAGRPSKAEIEREKALQTQVVEEFNADVVRLFNKG